MLSAEKNERRTTGRRGTQTACGAALDGASFAQEHGVAEDRHVVCWCAACHRRCTVVLGTLVGTGPEH